MQYSVKSNDIDGVDAAEASAGFVDASACATFSDWDGLGLEDGSNCGAPACVRLNLDGLKCFEVVEDQFKQWGVLFQNAIALQPSNPAFPACIGTTVLMGAPKNGFIEATFLQPVRFVSAAVTSSRQTVLSAYDSDGNLLSESKLSDANLAGSESSVPPNFQLSLRAPQIHRVKFSSMNGQLTLDDFSFSR